MSTVTIKEYDYSWIYAMVGIIVAMLIYIALIYGLQNWLVPKGIQKGWVSYVCGPTGLCKIDSSSNGAKTCQDCQNTCYVSAWSCKNGTCGPDPNGPYSTKPACEAACVPSVKYSCTNGTCNVDPNGIYSSKPNCENACAVSSQNYSCDGKFCYTDNNGQYNTLNACLTSCGSGALGNTCVFQPLANGQTCSNNRTLIAAVPAVSNDMCRAQACLLRGTSYSLSTNDPLQAGCLIYSDPCTVSQGQSSNLFDSNMTAL